MSRSRALKAAAWGVVAAGVAAPALRRRLRLRPPAVAVAAYAAPVALCVAVRRSRTRDVVTVALHMWAYLALYEMPHDDPAVLERRVRVRYPVLIDRVLGLGELPGVRLQRALSRPGVTTRLDAVLVWAHWLWFLVPHGTVAYLLVFHRDRFPRGAALMYAVYDLGVIVYWVLPTAPPWYAARNGAITADPALRRLMVEHGEAFWRERWEPLYSFLGGNPLAAMPSLHFATSLMAALLLADLGPLEGALGFAYAITLGFALVHLGEHYVVDLLAGGALTLAVRRLERRAGPLLARASRAVATVEAGAHA
ncbi:MAG TPA: phosphatase PAP2 family protein [Solirubrobacteraceae bacterium]